MLSTARTITGVVAATAGLVAIASPAFASDVDHNSEYNGINVGNGNNVQVPVGACNNNVAVLGAVVPVLSPQSVDNCSTAVIDQSHKPSHKPTTPPTTSHPGTSTSTVSPTETSPSTGGHPGGPTGSLPSAPAPTPVSGHTAVTG